MSWQCKHTGWDNGLSQDYDRKLFNWFASRVDARWTLRKNLYENAPAQKPVATPAQGDQHQGTHSRK